MDKKYLLVVAIVVIVGIIGSYWYYGSIVAEEELKKRNITVNQEINAYFNDLNKKNGDDGEEVGYLVSRIQIDNVTVGSQDQIEVQVQINFASNDPELIQETVSKAQDVMDSTGSSGSTYLSPEYVKAVSTIQLWKFVFKREGDEWKLESAKKVSET